MLPLTADDCSHCFSLRRDAKVRLEAAGTDGPIEIKKQLNEVLCREHTYLRDERLRKEARRAGRRA